MLGLLSVDLDRLYSVANGGYSNINNNNNNNNNNKNIPGAEPENPPVVLPLHQFKNRTELCQTYIQILSETIQTTNKIGNHLE